MSSYTGRYGVGRGLFRLSRVGILVGHRRVGPPEPNHTNTYTTPTLCERRASVGYRRAGGVAGEDIFDELAVGEDGSAVYQDELDAFGVLERVVEGGFVDDALGIEDGDVGVGTDADAALVFEHGGAILQALGRHQGHFAEGGHQVESFFFANVVAQDAREGALPAGMNFWPRGGHAVAGDHDAGVCDRGAGSLFRNGKDNHQAAFFTEFFEGFSGEALAGFAPLKIFVADALTFLPAGIENGGLEIGAGGGVGIALGGDVESVFLRALHHGDELRRGFESDAGDVHDVKRRSCGGSGSDDFFNADQTGGGFFHSRI